MLLDLVETVSDVPTSDAQRLATVSYLIHSGKVRFSGGVAGATLDLCTRAGAAPAILHRRQPPPKSRTPEKEPYREELP